MPDSSLKARLRHCRELEHQIKHACAKQRQAVSEKINAEIQLNVGLFSFALPMIICMLMLIVSFSLALLPVVETIAQWLILPSHITLVMAVAATMLFAGTNVLTTWFISKGFISAVNIVRKLMTLSLLVSVLSLVKSLSGQWFGLPHSASGIITALLACALVGGCFVIMRSRRFMDGLLFSLYCRAARMEAVADKTS
ncbi:hypothetical protein HQN64_09300 [Enterobacteriaceae bacterium BIT-l23]|uniref:Uncharacterized protein n=1 Tax=Jejubacter calystegiae TaxID=2579935 RepID=A0A4P8YGE3_9ENTR|nr:hypothetical protein [Jejubacter calystegiae]NUU66304.1 hypothetical protein [Enterobacteriaceae bacterium BIT-l23]QCT19709.1 hypothetical protein FEM41_08610 [Jejubacter calystegiae]